MSSECFQICREKKGLLATCAVPDPAYIIGLEGLFSRYVRPSCLIFMLASLKVKESYVSSEISIVQWRRRGVEVRLHTCLSTALDGVEGSRSRFVCITIGGKAGGTHSTVAVWAPESDHVMGWWRENPLCLLWVATPDCPFLQSIARSLLSELSQLHGSGDHTTRMKLHCLHSLSTRFPSVLLLSILYSWVSSSL